MLLSAIDPDLLIYQQEHWHTREAHFFKRIKALTLHRDIITQYKLQFAISCELLSMVFQSFPSNDDFKAIAELRDLRLFIMQELGKPIYVAKTTESESVSLQPSGLTGKFIATPEVLDAWKELLCALAEGDSEFDAQIATWESSTHPNQPPALTVTVNSPAGGVTYHLPLVWDDYSWVGRLASQDSWPNLHRCVELYFKANPGMQNYIGIRENPIPFEWTATFWKSVEDRCQPPIRQLLIKAIAKKVYGVLDPKLGDESLGPIRRFRVTDFWRVHYHQLDDRIVLEEFGQHDMGL